MNDDLDMVRMVRPGVEATDPARLLEMRSALMASVRLEQHRIDEGGTAPVPKRRRRQPAGPHRLRHPPQRADRCRRPALRHGHMVARGAFEVIVRSPRAAPR